MTDSGFQVSTRFLRNTDEYRLFHAARTAGFSEWYVGGLDRWAALAGRQDLNAVAALLPDFCHQVRDADGKPIAYLATAPAYWSGEPQALQDLHYYDEALRLRGWKGRALVGMIWAGELLRVPGLPARLIRGQGARRVSGCNTIVLVAMTVDPAHQGQSLPAVLIGAAVDKARKLGMEHVIAPFRPTGYGKYKAGKRAAHTNALFEEYVGLRTPEGLPQDPWLRVVARNGATFLKVEPRSYRLTKSMARFEAFRRQHRPGDWYEPAPNVWECGETPTWYVDPGKRSVTSVEPNLWGRIPIG